MLAVDANLSFTHARDRDAACACVILANARLGWRDREWEFAVDVLNALDRTNDDIAYFSTSRLSSEPAAGVNDILLHPAEPWTVRFSITKKF